MKQFFGRADVADGEALLQQARAYREQPRRDFGLGSGKTLGLVFFNASLRTRLSTQIAARNLDLEVLVMNMNQDGWTIETREGAVMDVGAAEHLKEAAGVLGRYCDVLGLRSFAGLQDAEADRADALFHQFASYACKPMLNLESATRHPLQSLADWLTIRDRAPKDRKAKVLLRWAPHVRALPQAVPNSFAEWMLADPQVELHISQPAGFELHPEFSTGAQLHNTPEAALADADFIYVKNWSATTPYGQIGSDPAWMLTEQQLQNSAAHIMHCLPVRRNVVLADELLDGPRALHLEQAENRIWAGQAALANLLQP